METEIMDSTDLFPLPHGPCQHAHLIESRPRPYIDTVVGTYRDAHWNPAAHGGITVTQECRACGARRELNQNGRHEEIGGWHAPLTSRQEAVRQIAAAVKAARVRRVVTATAPDGRQVQVSVDRQGYVVIDGEHTDGEQAAILAAAPDLVRQAAELRRLVLARQAAVADLAPIKEG